MIKLNLEGIKAYAPMGAIQEEVVKNSDMIRDCIAGKVNDKENDGFFDLDTWASEEKLSTIQEIADEVREKADVFVVIGVGGSNRGAQALLEPLGDDKVEIIYAGDDLSCHAIKRVLKRIEGKSVYIDCIAKNFKTIEPGIAFRTLRGYLEKVYGDKANERIIVTGSHGEGQLEELAEKHGYTFLDFPWDIGGRFSVMSNVGLLPVAVAGVDIKKVIAGARACRERLSTGDITENPAALYAVARNMLYRKGFVIESFTVFEKELEYLARWFVQLYGESEGKTEHCIFPTMASFSEDLHSLGQYIQDGERMIFETFLDMRYQNEEQIPQTSVVDGFEYLDGLSYDALNEAVYKASYTAHTKDGVPVIEFVAGEPTAESLGEFLYLMLICCVVSANYIGVSPFMQDGVEAYKKNMIKYLSQMQKGQ